GIKRELTAPYPPEQNGVAERKNRTVVEMTRSMLKSKGLPNSFLAEGVATAVYLLNISPTKAVWNETPYEAWCGNKPSLIGFMIASSEESMQNNRKFRSIDDIYAASPLILFAGDPLSVEEAIKKEEWRRAMEDELQAINKNMTWELVSMPQGKTAIGLKWIFKIEFLTHGSIQKHKARLVVKGYAQQQRIDYEETFSPVARFDTVRIILALAAQKQWKIFQFDVKSAFLNGDLHKEVYVSQPSGFENSDDPNKVFRLKKALYS
ncbi:retrovirus-related pol polyprotein from transposon TNT 1-94, partial [Tanacetum coccineum]